MGIKQSVYEKPGTLNYYKFSAKEYALVKKIWSGIEINPQFHGNACLRSFCEANPQYVKFFTRESKLHLSFDTRITAKFSIIMETLGYLLLDFNRKPKQLDRLVGYIAMVHKDMRLNEQDMRNLVTSLFEYLSRIYPTRMTSQCQESMSKFMESVIKELFIKMKTFRDYDIAQSGATTRLKSPWERFPLLFTEPPIFGRTKLYWDEWKKQWNARLDEWAAVAVQEPTSFTKDTLRSTIDLDDEDQNIGDLQRKAFRLRRKRRDSAMSASRLTLLSLSKTIVNEPNQTQERADKRRVSISFPNEHQEAANASRARHRVKSVVRKRSKSQIDETLLNVTTDRLALGKINFADRRNKKIIEQREPEFSEIAVVKSHNTARERRRKRFNNVDLK